MYNLISISNLISSTSVIFKHACHAWTCIKVTRIQPSQRRYECLMMSEEEGWIMHGMEAIERIIKHEILTRYSYTNLAVTLLVTLSSRQRMTYSLLSAPIPSCILITSGAILKTNYFRPYAITLSRGCVRLT